MARGPKDAAWLFAQECRFIAGATSLDAMPAPFVSEVAFAGRSNVGKSSLLNALTGRKHLARVSDTPGRTQQLNFFALDKYLMLVDLPGHGYARASKRRVRGWTHLTEDYIKGRPTLRRVLLLVDSKVGLMDSDRKLMDLMDRAGLSYQVVLTKCDRLDAADVAAMQARLLAELKRRPASHPEVAATSARNGHGINHLREELHDLAMGA